MLFAFCSAVAFAAALRMLLNHGNALAAMIPIAATTRRSSVKLSPKRFANFASLGISIT